MKGVEESMIQSAIKEMFFESLKQTFKTTANSGKQKHQKSFNVIIIFIMFLNRVKRVSNHSAN